MQESTRNIDTKIENEIAKFCDQHVYRNGIVFKRTKNVEEQKSGIDGFLTIESHGIFNAPTDEKAASHYVNKAIGTFTLELSQITRGGKVVDGWLLSDNNKTEYYMLMYLWATIPQRYNNKNEIEIEWKYINSKNITLVEYFLVKKSKIIEYLEQCGFDKDRLREAAKYTREHTDKENEEIQKKCFNTYGFKFTINRSFPENPVNICIKRDVYKKICVLRDSATRCDY